MSEISSYERDRVSASFTPEEWEAARDATFRGGHAAWWVVVSKAVESLRGRLAEAERERDATRAALAGLIPWVDGDSGPVWASPDATRRNREMRDAAVAVAMACLPVGTPGVIELRRAPVK